MSYRNDYQPVAVETIEKCVGKTGEKTSPDAWFDFRRHARIGKHQPYCPIEFVEEVKAFTGASLLEPEISFVDLLLRECEEPDVHLT